MKECRNWKILLQFTEFYEILNCQVIVTSVPNCVIAKLKMFLQIQKPFGIIAI